VSTKSLPAHGTYARANGVHGRRGPCNCGPCRTIRLRVKKRNKVNRQLGRASRVPAGLAQAHLKTLNETMTWPQIGDLAGCDHGNLREIANGHVPVILCSTQNKILAVQPQISAPGKPVDATGTTRRVRGLRALGYSPAFIAKAFGFSETHVRLLSRGDQPTVRHRIAVKVAAVFTELATVPAPRSTSATMSRNYAQAHGWAPPGAWDDIDDPNAVPDWTGHCGSDRGYWMHQRQQLPMCPRCEQAHEAWLDEHGHLSMQELNQERFRARAAATTREADLAHDARELMRVCGLTTEQAAERLDVTRPHLHQALKRHPAPAKTEPTKPQLAKAA
jgi:hypothetical protein